MGWIRSFCDDEQDPTQHTAIDNLMVQQLDGTINEWGWCKQKVLSWWNCYSTLPRVWIIILFMNACLDFLLFFSKEKNKTLIFNYNTKILFCFGVFAYVTAFFINCCNLVFFFVINICVHLLSTIWCSVKMILWCGWESGFVEEGLLFLLLLW